MDPVVLPLSYVRVDQGQPVTTKSYSQMDLYPTDRFFGIYEISTWCLGSEEIRSITIH